MATLETSNGVLTEAAMRKIAETRGYLLDQIYTIEFAARNGSPTDAKLLAELVAETEREVNR